MGPKLPTRLVTGYSATATTLPILHPTIYNYLDPLRSTWLARNWKQMLMWNNLPLDTNFFSAVMGALVPQWAKCLDVNSDYMVVWCVPCATHGGLMSTMCYTWRSDVCHVLLMAVDVYHVLHMAVWCVPYATHGGLMCTMCYTCTTHTSESEQSSWYHSNVTLAFKPPCTSEIFCIR
jgi:hypothetical protein